MARTLPGMPLAASDVYVCTGIGDPQPAAQLHMITPAQRPSLLHLQGRWLVLALCPKCIYRLGRYCEQHNARNWWLQNWGR
jgi:hypothetical protein